MTTLTDLLVVDVETSGLNPHKHEVLSVGLVPFAEPDLAHTIYVRPPRIEWTEFGLRNFQKFSAVWEANALAPAEACAALECYLVEVFRGRRATPVGHNVGFDQSFLKKLAHGGGRVELAGLGHRAIDTHTLLTVLHARGEIPAEALTSSGAFEYFGINVPEERRHTADGDALATRELLRNLFHALGIAPQAGSASQAVLI